MPAKKSTPHHHAAAHSLAAQLRKLSELTGNSQSGLIGELLEGSGPVFDRMIQVMEAAKTAKEAMRGRIAGDIEKAQSRVEEGLGMALEGFDQWTGSLLDEAEAVTRRGWGKKHSGAPHAPARQRQPPCLTGGSGTTRKLQKT